MSDTWQIYIYIFSDSVMFEHLLRKEEGESITLSSFAHPERLDSIMRLYSLQTVEIIATIWFPRKLNLMSRINKPPYYLGL